LAGIISYKTVKVWDRHTGQEIVNFKGHANAVECLTFSPDGKRLASGDGLRTFREAKPVPGVVKVWDAQTGQELVTFKGHGYCVLSVTFSPDGKRLASAAEDGTVKVWDAQTGQEFLSLKEQKAILVGSNHRFASLAFSPDGKRLAGCALGPLKVWDAQTGQELVTGMRGGLSLAFSPDGKRLASALGNMVVYDAQTGQEVLTFPGGSSVAFSPDGKRLVSGTKVWDAQTGEEILSLQGAGGSLTFSRDGHQLGSASIEGIVKIWDATPLPEKP
jgi:WD40 repeat protein